MILRCRHPVAPLSTSRDAEVEERPCTSTWNSSAANNIANCELRRADMEGIVSPVVVCILTNAPSARSSGQDIPYNTILVHPFYTVARCASACRCTHTRLVVDPYLWDFDISCGLRRNGSIQLPWNGDDDELE